MTEGWHIDDRTLRAVIDDEATFRSANAGDPALDLLVALWSGDASAALHLADELCASDPDGWRVRALRADVLRDLGRHDEAISVLERLLVAHRGTKPEAVLAQHLGKAHIAAGHHRVAIECFARALDLRVAHGADPSLVASSRQALERAKELADAESDRADR